MDTTRRNNDQLMPTSLPFNRVLRNPTLKDEIRDKGLGDSYTFGPLDGDVARAPHRTGVRVTATGPVYAELELAAV